VAVNGLAARLRPKPTPAMIGTPPSARFPAIPPDSAEHAVRSAHEWADVAEAYTQKRMRELGIPERQIGAPDHERASVRHAFLPDETNGGTNDFATRLFVDSGVLNPELNASQIGPEASTLWEKSRLRDRMDAVIAHEHEEARGIPHDEVVERAPDTTLPIGDNARRMLRTIAEGVKRQADR